MNPLSRNAVRAFASTCATLVFALSASIARGDDASCLQHEQDGLEVAKASIVILQLAPLCYGVKGEQNPLTLEVRAALERDPTTTGDLASLLRLIATHVSGDSAHYRPEPARSQLITSLDKAAQQVEGVTPPGINGVSPLLWKLEAGESALAVPNLALATSLDAVCTIHTTTPACTDAIDGAKAWTRVLQLTESVLTAYGAPALRELTARSKARLAQWHAYRDDGLPQFQWEWAINSARLYKDDNRQRDAKGQPIGPREVPNSQLIVMHPGVGMEWRDAVANGSKAQPSIYLEVLGINRWTWDDAQMRHPSGISLVSTYAKRAQQTDVGFGLMFHWAVAKPMALAVTRSKGNTSVLLSVDLAEYVKDKMAYWQGVESEIKNFRGVGFP